MIAARIICGSVLAGCGLITAVLAIEGCGPKPGQKQRPLPAPVALTIAVGPAMNLSGSTDFDPVAVGDILASEMTLVDEVRVVGVNRVLAMMAELGWREVRSPQDVFELINRLGVDGVVVFAVTEYDPYSPPVVGMAAQLYLAEDRPEAKAFDPLSTSRSAAAVAETASTAGTLPSAEVQRIFNGASDAVVVELRNFARDRRADRSPYAWRKYLASQQHFLRFCCSTVARDLVGQVREARRGAEIRTTD